MMVVMGEMLGEFVAGEIVVGDDAGHHAGCLEHDEVAVCARLRESSVGLEHLRDGHGLAACEERLDECPAALGESLVTRRSRSVICSSSSVSMVARGSVS